MNLTDNEKKHAAKLATRFQKHARYWRYNRIIAFIILFAGIGIFQYSHKQVKGLYNCFPAVLPESAKHIPADMDMVNDHIQLRILQLKLVAFMSLNSMMLLGLGIFMVVRSLSDWHRDRTYVLVGKLLQEISQQSGPGYPPQGVGSPDP